MSLACRECNSHGSFDTLILFSKNGEFEAKKPASHFENFCTDCASIDDFTAVTKSKFMIVKTKTAESCWNTGNDGPALSDCETKRISARELKQRLPKTYKAFLQA
jgi:hypothetical protein